MWPAACHSRASSSVGGRSKLPTCSAWQPVSHPFCMIESLTPLGHGCLVADHDVQLDESDWQDEAFNDLYGLWVLENGVISCDLRVFANEAAELVPALVAGPASEAMTCGYAVDEAVDNSAHAWITTVILWIAEKISVASPGLLAPRGTQGVEILPRRTRTPPQGKPQGRGRNRETGTGSGWLAPAVGPPEPVLLGEPASLDR
jgi:hypothetical protein